LHIRKSRSLVSIYVGTSASEGLEGYGIARHGMLEHASGSGRHEPFEKLLHVLRLRQGDCKVFVLGYFYSKEPRERSYMLGSKAVRSGEVRVKPL